MMNSRWKLGYFCARNAITILLTAVAMTTAGPLLAAGWYDDFEDGSIADGSPVTWLTNPLGVLPGDYVVIDGDLSLSAVGDPLGDGGNDNSLTATVPMEFTDTYVRTQGRVQEDIFGFESGNVAPVVRFDPNTFTGYAAFLDHGGLLTFIRVDGIDIGGCGGACFVPLDVVDFDDAGDANTDIIMELNAVGDRIDLFFWRPGESKPATPQSTVFDSTYTSGQAGVSFNEDTDGPSGVFAFAQALDRPIPEIGDLNGDGGINFGDLEGFVQSLTDPAGYAASFPGFGPVCDASGDGACNFDDLQPFVDLLLGQGTAASSQQVPEPTAACLLVLGTLFVGSRNRRTKS